MWKLEFLQKLTGLGLLALRVAVGVGFVIHGLPKLGIGEGLSFDGGAGFVEKMGGAAPAALLYIAAWTEVLAGVGVTVGLLTRWAALGLCCVMGYAIFAVHWGQAFEKVELAYLYGAGALTLLTHGAGPMSLDRLILDKGGKRD